MEKFTLNKCKVTLESIILIIVGALSVYMYIVSLNIVYVPIIVLVSLKILYDMILYFRWIKSYAIIVDSDKIIFNHTLLLKNVSIPLSDIENLDRNRKNIQIKESQRGNLPLFYKSGSISLHTLTKAECSELFSALEMHLK